LDLVCYVDSPLGRQIEANNVNGKTRPTGSSNVDGGKRILKNNGREYAVNDGRSFWAQPPTSQFEPNLPDSEMIGSVTVIL
jgi:hypothetical protein